MRVALAAFGTHPRKMRVEVVGVGGFGYRARRMSSRPPSVSRWKATAVKLWPWAAAALSGVLLVLCFPPWHQQWLCWVALTPLIAAIWFGDTRTHSVDLTPPPALPANDSPSRRFGRVRGVFRRLPKAWRRSELWARPFALGYVAGLIFYWGAFYWLTEVTGLGWFCLSFYMGLYGATWGWFIGTVGNAERDGRIPPPAAPLARPAGSSRQTATVPAQQRSSPYLRSRWNLWFALLGAMAWVGLEWVRGMLFSGFGWNDLGTAFHANLPFLQIVEWTGVGGLSFLAALANLIAVSTVYRFSLEVRIHKIRPHFDFTLTMAAVLLVFAYGLRTLQSSAKSVSRVDNSVPLRVAAVQANIPQNQKWDEAFEANILKTYERLTDAALASRPQLLLWPEAATPKAVFLDEANHRFVMDTAQRAACNFLLGTLDMDFGEDGRILREYNAALFLPKDGGDSAIYHKIHLVPFGEFIPLRYSFPLFAWIVGDQVPGDFSRGVEPAVFQTVDPKVRIAPLICFEDTVGRVARQPVAMGAQLLVNLTNDGWFGLSAANEQQLNESVFRAVENRRPLVRCANTGVTAFVDRDGRIVRELRSQKGSPFVEGVLMGEMRVPVDPALTFYTRHGEVFSVACGAAALGAALLSALRSALNARRKKRERELPATLQTSPLETAR